MRLKIIRWVFFFLLILIILRLFYWQIFYHDELVAKAEGQRIIKREVVAPRGSILFFDGSILAGSEPAFSVYLQPKDIDDEISKKFTKERQTTLLSAEPPSDLKKIINLYKKDFAKKLSSFLSELDFKNYESTQSAENLKTSREEKEKELDTDIYKKLNEDLYWVSLNRKIDLSAKQRLEKLELKGIGFDETSLRFYPEGSSSSHLLGFVASDAYGEEAGYFGLEGFYNGELKGKKGLLTQEKDALGLPILIGKFLVQEAKPGKTLTLSLDRTIQHIVEEKLKTGLEKYGAKGASAVVMDPKTGKILAMASYPDYDPLRAFEFPNSHHRNPITADSYEPGSTFKVLVMAAALNEGLVTPETRCDICTGPLSLSGYTIRTWNNKYNPNATMTDVIIHSDNTGMVFAGKRLGADKLYDYITGFGFGKPTRIDLQDESSPPLRAKKDWKEIDLATASFGQGISVTPIQLITAVSAIANGGKLMEPQIVSVIRDQEKIYPIKPRIVAEPLKSETARLVKDMMVRAVDEGEAKFAKKLNGLVDYKIAGKTGTAQVAVAGHYDKDKTIASFIGFAPADEPRF
ncbi:penicillin-binding protein 2, partial [Candidatus Daviesbacteria bacterium]|nr:penicillin-binding protein 2 [Candidatus Daviesbacteria bacterium]